METNESLSQVPEEVTGELVELTEDPRPFLTTPFAEYTVTEGLLLAVFLCLFFSALVRIIKEGFYWLL